MFLDHIKGASPQAGMFKVASGERYFGPTDSVLNDVRYTTILHPTTLLPFIRNGARAKNMERPIGER